MSEEAKPVCAYCLLPITNGLADWHQTRHAKPTYCVDALRAALDQERADNAKLRAFALAAITDPDDVSEAWSLVVVMKQHGLLDDNAHPTALLSGRGEDDHP